MATLDEKLSRVENNIAASLEAAAEMGAEVPEGANSNNLPNLIRSIPKGGGASSWNDLTDRPFGEFIGSDTLKWDGNTDGLVSVNGSWYKVSDLVPTLDDLADGVTYIQWEETRNAAFDDIISAAGIIGIHNNIYIVSEEAVGVAYDSKTFPEAGIYFYYPVTSFTVHGYAGFPYVKTLDPKFFLAPDLETEGLAADAKMVGTASMQALHAAIIASDGAIVKTYAELYAEAMATENPIVHVSDKVPALSDLQKGFSFVVFTGAGEENVEIPGTLSGYAGIPAEVPPMSTIGEDVFNSLVMPLDDTGSILFIFPGIIVAKQAVTLEGMAISKGVSFLLEASATLAFRVNGFDFSPDQGDTTITYSPTLTWDGNTAGRTVVDLGDDAKLVHVSDATPTMANLQAGYTAKLFDGSVVSTANGDMEPLEIGEGLLMLVGEYILVAQSDGVVFNGLAFPKKGIYFASSDEGFISELTINGYQFEVEGSKATATELTWDGVTTGPDDIIQDIGDTDHTKMISHHASSSAPTEADIKKGFEYKIFNGSEMQTRICSANDDETYAEIVTVNTDTGVIYFGLDLAIFPKDMELNNNAYKKGIYFTGVGNAYVASLKINGYTFTLLGEPEIIGLPAYTAADEGKVLKIVNGAPAWVSIPNAEEASF